MSRLKALLRLTAAAAVGAAVTATVFMSTGDAQGSDPSTAPTRATSTAGHAIFYPAGADLYNCDDYTDGYGSAVQWKAGETGDVRSRFNRAGAGTCQQSRVARAGENGVSMRSCLSKMQRITRCGPWRSIGAG